MTLLWVGEGRLSMAGPLAWCSAFVPAVARPLSQLRNPPRLPAPLRAARRHVSANTVLADVRRCTYGTGPGSILHEGVARFTGADYSVVIGGEFSAR